jgi:hypothetical protein
MMENEINSHRLSFMVDHITKNESLSRYKYLDSLVEISSIVSSLTGHSNDEIFKKLSESPSHLIRKNVNSFFVHNGKPYLSNVA